jgi:hypothetical protein
MIAGRETIVFDLHMRQRSLDGFREKSGYSGITATIVGFRVPADCYCRSRDILQPESWRKWASGSS